MGGQVFQGDERNSPRVMYCSAGPSSVLLMLVSIEQKHVAKQKK